MLYGMQTTNKQTNKKQNKKNNHNNKTLIYRMPYLIEGFHVTSYQANFASHHTCNRSVGFFSAQGGIWKYSKMSHYFLSSLFYTTKLKLRDKNITTHTRLKFQILIWSKSKETAFFVVFLYTVPHRKETKGRDRIVCV